MKHLFTVSVKRVKRGKFLPHGVMIIIGVWITVLSLDYCQLFMKWELIVAIVAAASATASAAVVAIVVVVVAVVPVN